MKDMFHSGNNIPNDPKTSFDIPDIHRDYIFDIMKITSNGPQV